MALRNDGTSTKSLQRTTNLPTTSAHTVMLWAMLTADRNAYSSFAAFQSGWYLQTTGNGTTLNLYTTGDHAGTDLSLNIWYHLCVTHAGSGTNNAKCYLNSSLDIQTDGLSDASFGATRLWLLNDWDTEPLNGKIAAVKIWSAVLTPEEIASEMRCFVPIRTANLNTWLPCIDSVLANNALDLSGNGYNMTVGGTPTIEDGPPIPWRLGRRRMIWVPSGGVINLALANVAQVQSLGSPALTQVHLIQPVELTQAQSITSPTLTQAHVLQPDDLSQAQAITSPTLTQVPVLAPADLSQSQSLESSTLTQTHVIQPADVTQTQTPSSPAITQVYAVEPDNLAQSHTLSSPSVVQGGTVSPDSLLQGQSLSSPVVSQTHVAGPDDLVQSQSLESSVVTISAVSIDSVSQGHSLGQPAITQVYILASTGLLQSQSLGLPSVGEVSEHPFKRTPTWIRRFRAGSQKAGRVYG